MNGRQDNSLLTDKPRLTRAILGLLFFSALLIFGASLWALAAVILYAISRAI